MEETVSSKSGEIATGNPETIRELLAEPVWVRVAPNSYLLVSFVLTFFSGLFVYLEFDYTAAAAIALAWVVIPILIWFDRIVFDGKRFNRTGILPRLWASFNGSRSSLDLDEVEQVESQALRALKRGGSVFYRYRTTISGKDTNLVVASGGENYRKMVRKFLPLLSENLLDNRSIELRDYISEPKETLMKAEFAKVPSAEVLEESIHDFDTLRRKTRNRPAFGDEDIEKADYLRTLANELRLSGYLLQALEVFRRALFLNPKDGWLLFEFARCLHSFAGSEKNARLEHRALAVLRLAEMRAEGDRELLSRLGESYYQYGEWTRALKVFKRTLAQAEDSFRAARGMAEIALREGKIAHVIHHFSTANRLAQTPSLRRWTEGEAAYFSALNSDEEYMDLEVSRVRLLETLERAKGMSLRIAMFGLPAILLGVFSETEAVANIGWAVSCASLLIWLGIVVTRNILSDRVPLEHS